jgi:hypothetical protein
MPGKKTVNKPVPNVKLTLSALQKANDRKLKLARKGYVKAGFLGVGGISPKAHKTRERLRKARKKTLRTAWKKIW